jgi:methionyl-tRNA formyltransferase
MNSKLDAGDILLQQDLSLKGSLGDILSRMEKNDYEIICKIIQGKFKRRKQRGVPSFYKRRTPEQSELINLNHPKSFMYNFIRMLADPYPNAFIRIGKRKIIFKLAKFDGRNLSFQGVIE